MWGKPPEWLTTLGEAVSGQGGSHKVGLERMPAIEPLNRQESNIVNSVAEGLALMRRVKRDEVQILADYYHMALESEDLSILRQAGPALRALKSASTYAPSLSALGIWNETALPTVSVSTRALVPSRSVITTRTRGNREVGGCAPRARRAPN